MVSGLQVSGCTRQATIARWKYRGNQLVKPLKSMVSKNQQPYGTVLPNAVRSWIQAITADAGEHFGTKGMVSWEYRVFQKGRVGYRHAHPSGTHL